MSVTQATARPMLASARASSSILLDKVIEATGKFDADVWNVIDKRDNALIEQEILHGSGSSKFVYSFDIKGSGQVSGISVVGARHIAAHYGGLQHRIVASVQKVGSLHTFTSYPQERVPMRVECSIIAELAHEPDYYAAVVEVKDAKNGNTIQMEAREERWGESRSGTVYEKPHYGKIAQAKAYRNAILALIPQDVQIKWKTEMLKLGKDDIITDSVIDEKRTGILKFAAKNALPIERAAVEALTMEQIAGLSEAAREGKLPAFSQAAQALGLLVAGPDSGEEQPAEQQQKRRGRPPRSAQQPGGQSPDPPPYDPSTGEIHDHRPPGETSTNGQSAPAPEPNGQAAREVAKEQPPAPTNQPHHQHTAHPAQAAAPVGHGARKDLF